MALKINRKVQLITKIVSIGLLIILCGMLIKVFIWEQNYYSTKTNEKRKDSEAVITNISYAVEPSEQPISQEEHDKYQPEVDDPRYLVIERLNIDAIVRSAEIVDSGNTLPVPSNIYETTWYSGSSQPGKNGNILISGLATGETKDGLFANLGSLETGDELKIIRGDGNEYYYNVKEINIINPDDAVRELPKLQQKIDGEETLTLVTALKKVRTVYEYSSIVAIRATPNTEKTVDNSSSQDGK